MALMATMKNTRRRRAALLHWAYVPNWRATRPAAAEAPGTLAHGQGLIRRALPRLFQIARSPELEDRLA